MKNKIIYISIISLIILLIIIKIAYKKGNIGNNINNLDEYINYILDINSYNAIIEVTINGNKKTNTYLISQETKDDRAVQKILEPDNLKGVEFIYEGDKVTVKNLNLNLQKTYSDYVYMNYNYMFLTDFIKQYKESKNNIREDDEDIIIEIKNENRQQLIFNKKELKPKQLITQDNNHKREIYIQYKEININN